MILGFGWSEGVDIHATGGGIDRIQIVHPFRGVAAQVMDTHHIRLELSYRG